jgi:signal transduction histidine kinase
VLWTLRPHLPQLGSGVAGGASSLTATDVVVGLFGAALFLAAAVRFSIPHAGREPEPVLLGPALVLAAFAHVHYMLIPSVFTDRISTGDLLRVGFTITVLVGLMWEIRNAFATERTRAVRLEAAFAAERERVRELERLDRAHAELLRLVTHELMHPIAAVRGWVVTLRRRWDTLDDAKKLEIIGRLDAESVRLRDLAERAPEAADAGTLLQPVLLRVQPVPWLVDQAVEAAEDLNGRLRVYVDKVARASSVRADSTRVLQVLRNLLANAARYGGESEVELSVFGDPETVLFEVRDFGPGIPAPDLPHVFKQGYRGAHAGDDDGGAGLGLFICRRIVEAHGGEIWATSDPGRTTTMSFTLPVDEGAW